jgi:hypothetical protein
LFRTFIYNGKDHQLFLLEKAKKLFEKSFIENGVLNIIKPKYFQPLDFENKNFRDNT